MVKEIKTRIEYIIEPKFSEIISKLKPSEIEYFIHHISHNFEKSLYEWKLKIKEV